MAGDPKVEREDGWVKTLNLLGILDLGFGGSEMVSIVSLPFDLRRQFSELKPRRLEQKQRALRIHR